MEIHHQFKKAKELLGNLQFNPEVFRVIIVQNRFSNQQID